MADSEAARDESPDTPEPNPPRPDATNETRRAAPDRREAGRASATKPNRREEASGEQTPPGQDEAASASSDEVAKRRPTKKVVAKKNRVSQAANKASGTKKSSTAAAKRGASVRSEKRSAESNESGRSDRSGGRKVVDPDGGSAGSPARDNDGGDRPARKTAPSPSAANKSRSRRSQPRNAGRQPETDRPAEPVTADELPDLPDRHIEGRPKSREAAERALVPRKPKIGDSMPAPGAAPPAGGEDRSSPGEASKSRNRRRGSGRPSGDQVNQAGSSSSPDGLSDGPGETARERSRDSESGSGQRKRRRRGGRGKGRGSGTGAAAGSGKPAKEQPRDGHKKGRNQQKKNAPVQATVTGGPVELNEEDLARRRGRQRKGKPVGRYQMCVNVQRDATQIAVLEGRHLIEHYVARPSDEVTQIHGNVYLGRVQNVLPGMEAAFIDIGTPKNAVLYRGDVHYDPADVESSGPPRIEEMLKARQTIICQVTKNPIAHKGARLTQEVSLPGRFVVLIPNSSTYGISKRLPDVERKRLRDILDRAKPDGHGIIVRTAAEGVTEEEIVRDVHRLSGQWDQIEALAKKSKAPSLLYREPDLALRVIREEFNKEYRGIVIDDRQLHDEVADYVRTISPALTDRVSFYDTGAEKLSLFERHHVHEQLHKALDRKVWLPSGGSLIIEHTEALTVIDVNTGKNVGKKSLEDTVLHNNLEAAEEVARQLRLRDIGGIIVIDFVDMEIRASREKVIKVFRDALARDKTRTQVFDISELGLVEMTRKRIGEGLLESLSGSCPECAGRGVVFDGRLLGESPVAGG